MSRHANRDGFSLVELLVGLTVLGVVLTSIFGVIIQMQRQHLAQVERGRAEENMRVVDLVIRTMLRSAGADPMTTAQAIVDPDPENLNRFEALRITSDFNPPDRDFADPLEDVQLRLRSDTLLVRWRAGAAFEPYIYPVDSLKFQYYDRTGALITTRVGVANAIRVRFTFVMSPDPYNATKVVRRESWVYLRNRR